MSLQCLAIVGKSNEPLYLRDIATIDEQSHNPDEEKKDDVFGFSDAVANDSLSLRHEFMMHASLDLLEESIGLQPRWRGQSKSNTKWIGRLWTMEDSCIYGYVTSTNVKFLAMVCDTEEPIREVHLKTLFVSQVVLSLEGIDVCECLSCTVLTLCFRPKSTIYMSNTLLILSQRCSKRFSQPDLTKEYVRLSKCIKRIRGFHMHRAKVYLSLFNLKRFCRRIYVYFTLKRGQMMPL